MSEVDEARRKRLKALAADVSEPDTSDIGEAAPAAWAGAEVGRFFRPRKESVSLRLDADVLDWFRRSAPDGRGYQTAINTALREHVAARSRRESD